MRPIGSEVVNYGSNDCLVHVTPDVDAFPHQFLLMMLIRDMKATSRKCVQDVACQGVGLRNSLKLLFSGIWNVTL